MNNYQRQLKKTVADLPTNAVYAAINDPVMRAFWCFYAFIAVICFTAEPLIHWLTN